ncbi:MAG: HAMP domain-containing sensor histidine kinase, partial [Deltaproteobacteria bacterium]
VRLLVHGFLTSGNERLFLYVAEGIKEELDLLRSFRVFLLIVFPLAILLTGIGSIVIVQLSVKPLTSFSRQIGLITEKRLHERVDSHGVDAELKELASSFNDTLDRLEKAFQAQRDFLSDASHELRTPTAVIKSTADVTLRRERTIAEYTEAMKTVKDASERMGGLIDRLLKLSRLDAELAKFKNEKVSLKDVLDITLKTISPLAQERDIKVNAEKIEEIVIAGDKEQLIELFLSILDNSIKYNRPNGSVTVSMVRSREWAITRITDTGVGIASEALDKVFDRFYRADLSRGETAGTGLGLPIAKGIAESHGGRIEVESRVGEGSAFTVYLPLTTSS